MTDEPRSLVDLINAALSEHLEGQGFVTSWHFVADYVDADGDLSWIYAAPDDQRQTTTLGLIEWARGIARYEQDAYLDSIRTDDDD